MNDTQTVSASGESDDDADNESLTVEFGEEAYAVDEGGTLEMRGEGSLTIRVRGRFGDIWDTWSPPVILFCLPSLDRDSEGDR